VSSATSPLAMFDSGVGGLAVLREVRELLPAEDIIYVADNRFFPYGARPRTDVLARARAITSSLLRAGAKLIVVACNTATSAAIADLRAEWPDVPFVGMEPALKPAAARTLAGRVALLVTPGTARGEKLAALIDRYGAEVHVETIEAPGLADLVEAGDVAGDAARMAVRDYIAKVEATGADVLVLGCTHYAFLRPLFEEAAGDGLAVIEPSRAVAHQVRRLLDQRGLRRPEGRQQGIVRYLCSGDEATFARVRDALLGSSVTPHRA